MIHMQSSAEFSELLAMTLSGSKKYVNISSGFGYKVTSLARRFLIQKSEL
jgi:hypothetical protein